MHELAQARLSHSHVAPRGAAGKVCDLDQLVRKCASVPFQSALTHGRKRSVPPTHNERNLRKNRYAADVTSEKVSSEDILLTMMHRPSDFLGDLPNFSW